MNSAKKRESKKAPKNGSSLAWFSATLDFNLAVSAHSVEKVPFAMTRTALCALRVVRPRTQRTGHPVEHGHPYFPQETRVGDSRVPSSTGFSPNVVMPLVTGL